MTETRIDLAQRGNRTEHSYALGYLRALARGQEIELLAQEEPRLLMDALTLELRNAIYWDVVEAGPPQWRVRIRRREDVEASDLVDLLTRDHERIDRLFAAALHHTNAGNMAEALPLFAEYAQRLRNHVEAENEIVEHTVMIEEMVGEGMDDAGMLAPFFAIISGQLAKHEWREENNLFPHWMRILRHDPSIAHELFPKVRRLVTFGETHR